MALYTTQNFNEYNSDYSIRKCNYIFSTPLSRYHLSQHPKTSTQNQHPKTSIPKPASQNQHPNPAPKPSTQTQHPKPTSQTQHPKTSTPNPAPKPSTPLFLYPSPLRAVGLRSARGGVSERSEMTEGIKGSSTPPPTPPPISPPTTQPQELTDALRLFSASTAKDPLQLSIE